MQNRIAIWSSYTCLIVSLAGFSTLAMANPRVVDYKNERVWWPICVSALCLRDGLYAGAGLGYNTYRISQNIDVTDSDGTLDEANPSLHANGAVGNILIGYGRYFDWFYFAGEIYAGYSGASDSFSLNDYQSNVDVRTSLGVDFLPGIKLTRASRIFARVGYVRTYFKSSESGTAIGSDTPSDWANGLSFGLGIETAVYKNISIRAGYRYTDYSSFSSLLGTTYNPSSSQFMVDVLYYFG